VVHFNKRRTSLDQRSILETDPELRPEKLKFKKFTQIDKHVPAPTQWLVEVVSIWEGSPIEMTL